jgi:hypothetical protein
MLAFYCEPCQHAETKVMERAGFPRGSKTTKARKSRLVHVLPKNASGAPLLPLIVDLIVTFVGTRPLATSEPCARQQSTGSFHENLSLASVAFAGFTTGLTIATAWWRRSARRWEWPRGGLERERKPA